MFTGIIEEIGTVLEVEPRLRIRVSEAMRDLQQGESVAVNGVCLTVVDARTDSFCADVSEETLKRSSLGALRPGSLVNLERALQASSRLGGHIVQGHVDGVGEVVSFEDGWLEVRVPPELEPYLVFKGSVAVDGISLTVARMEGGIVSVAIIPHTFERTNLKTKQPGDPVNIETDVLAKYVEKMLAAMDVKRAGLTVEDLTEQGY